VRLFISILMGDRYGCLLVVMAMDRGHGGNALMSTEFGALANEVGWL
jgi:hypothetical protein